MSDGKDKKSSDNGNNESRHRSHKRSSVLGHVEFRKPVAVVSERHPRGQANHQEDSSRDVVRLAHARERRKSYSSSRKRSSNHDQPIAVEPLRSKCEQVKGNKISKETAVEDCVCDSAQPKPPKRDNSKNDYASGKHKESKSELKSSSRVKGHVKNPDNHHDVIKQGKEMVVYRMPVPAVVDRPASRCHENGRVCVRSRASSADVEERKLIKKLISIDESLQSLTRTERKPDKTTATGDPRSSKETRSKSGRTSRTSTSDRHSMKKSKRSIKHDRYTSHEEARSKRFRSRDDLEKDNHEKRDSYKKRDEKK